VAIAESVVVAKAMGESVGGQRVWHFVGGPRLWSSRAAACAEDAHAPSAAASDRTPERKCETPEVRKLL